MSDANFEALTNTINVSLSGVQEKAAEGDYEAAHADEDDLRDLLSHIDNWKMRKAAKEELLARLTPLFAMMTNGGTIEGLNAYVK